MSEVERQLVPLTDLLRSATELTEQERATARERFLHRVGPELERKPQKRRPTIRYLAPLAVAASVLLVFLLWRPSHGLDYSVKGAVVDGDYLRVSPDRPADILFSDSSRIHVSPGSRLRIDEDRSKNGARIAVERGRLEVSVVHAEQTNWRFVAGPFLVRVTGTRFTFAWDVEAERLEVVLHEGSVDVAGYSGSGSVTVKAGQRFTGDAKQRTMLVSDIQPPIQGDEPELSPSTALQPVAPAVVPSASASTKETATTPPASSTVGTGTTSWRELVSKGDFKEVVAQATARGTSSCMASCSATDLSALADAARYVGRTDLARQALMALRSRYGASHGVRAAFMLGRMSETGGDAAGAKDWYERVLREGGGGFASEALAGKMRTVKTLQGTAAAREIAREYLRRYPQGAHAEAAKQLSGQP